MLEVVCKNIIIHENDKPLQQNNGLQNTTLYN